MRHGFVRDDLPGLAGLLAPALMLASQDSWFSARLLFCAVLVIGWQSAFAFMRGQGVTPYYSLVSAALVAICVPASAPFWQLAIGISFGFVLGEAVFGGRGRNFVQPVVLTLAFLAFSFADQPWREGVSLPIVVALPALALLVSAGQARLSVLLAFAIALAVPASLISPELPALFFKSGIMLLALLFLTADPVTSGSTTAGRILYGLLAGGLTALFSTGGPAFGALVFATLLASIFAPLLDHMVASAHTRFMRRRARRLRNV
ncbi:RnfABCDGE type electron transport complex subunit D [Aquamicrobium defluvii]|uniref:NADH-quinone reductase n=1 Tax=Aquamicrobium defluvii TaxID=69279 RepID=A0A011V3D9_9HYPH|nr:RnfABCDGE type electron transport complex subunit D [Aquamicrobium defluvii]EXL03010.1 NADH-quinone reductase [Aquamicrobium defluvii]EZQ13431.1 NADH-quinone reductase [Halopseudomonas bauzanensis]